MKRLKGEHWHALRGVLKGVVAVLSAICVAACGGGGNPAAELAGTGGPSPVVNNPGAGTDPAPADWAGGPHTVAGIVFSFDTGVIGDASINLWVDMPAFGYSWWWANGPLSSDGIGRFEAKVPSSHVTILAFKDGFVQPCAVMHQVDGDLVMDVEMLPIAFLDSFDSPRPQTSVGPSLTGMIFETTANGRQPIAGVDLWAEQFMDVGMATTISDRGGGFFLCNLGEVVWLHVSKPGFESQWIGPLNTSELQVVEIELHRQ